MVTLRLENLATDVNLDRVVLYEAIFAEYPLHNLDHGEANRAG